MPTIEEAIRANRRRLLAQELELMGRLAELGLEALGDLELRAQRAAELAERRVEQGRSPMSALMTEARFIELQNQLRSSLGDFAQGAARMTEATRRRAVLATAADFRDLLEAIDVEAGADPGALQRTIAAIEPQTPLATLFDRLAPDIAERARRAMFTGVAAGDNPRVIARRFGRAVDLSRTRAETIARTEVLRAYRGSMRERMALSPQVNKWVWISARDRRTCAMCWAMHGETFELGEPMATHPNCRCSQAPVASRMPVDVGRGSMHFYGLDSRDQLHILGPAKYRAWKAGAIQLEDLVGFARHPEWGPVRFERSLQGILGPGARAYYTGVGRPPAPPRAPGPRIAPPRPPAAPPRAAAPTPRPAAPSAPRVFTDQRTVADVTRRLGELYPETHFDMAGLDLGVANRIARQFSVLANQFPPVQQALRYVGTNLNIPPELSPFVGRFKRGTNTVAHASRPFRGSEVVSISLNTAKLAHASAAAEARVQNTSTKWLTPQADPSDYTAVMTHEFGHAVKYWLETRPAMLGLKGITGARASGLGFARDTFNMWMRQLGPDIEPVSNYARENEQEAFAEAFAGVFHGTPEVRGSTTVKNMIRMLEVLAPANHTGQEIPFAGDLTQAQREAAFKATEDLARRLGITEGAPTPDRPGPLFGKPLQRRRRR